jgi:phospholipid-translocating ATPase
VSRHFPQAARQKVGDWDSWLTNKLPIRILDTHNKTIIVLVSFVATVTAWWVWQGVLTSIYSKGVSPYAVRNGFSTTFGSDPVWWLALLVVLFLLASIELSYRAIKRGLMVSGLRKWGWKWMTWYTWKKAFRAPATEGVWAAAGSSSGGGLKASAEEWEVELWQELEQDANVKKMLGRMSCLGDRDDEIAEDSNNVEMPPSEPGAAGGKTRPESQRGDDVEMDTTARTGAA